MHERLRFSQLAHFWQKDNIVAIFHRLNRQVVFVQAEILPLLKTSLSRRIESDFKAHPIIIQLITHLKRYKLAVPINYKEEKEIVNIRKSILARPCIDTLYLILTDYCNFNCTYCFFQGSYKTHLSTKMDNMMSEKIAFDSVNKFTNYLQKAYEFPDFHPTEPGIVFYGGEPLLNDRVLCATIKKIECLKKERSLPPETMININTNGSLITSELATFFAQHNIEVDVSLDGYQAMHDACRIRYRRNNKEKGTFFEVMKGISILKKAGVNLCISCTISEANVEELPAIFEWFLDELGIDQIGFNPLLNSYHYQVQDINYFQKVSRALIECFKIARKRGIYEARIMRKVKAFVEQTIYDRDCCGCGRQIVVCPDGSFGVCHAYTGTKEFFVMPTDNFNPYTHHFWQEWSQRSPLNMAQCYNCEALTICGGGCPHNAHLQKGSIWDIDETFCVHAKDTIKWLVWDLYKQSQNEK